MVKKLQIGAELLASGILALIVIIMFAQIISRYLLEISLSWPEEVSRYLLVWLVFIGGAAAVGAGQQLVVDTVIDVVPPRFQRIARIVAPIGGLVGLGILLYTVIPLFGPPARTTSPASGIPLGWVYLALPVGCVLSGIFLIHSLIAQITRPDNTESDTGGGGQ